MFIPNGTFYHVEKATATVTVHTFRSSMIAPSNNAYPAATAASFEKKEYNVTNWIQLICSIPSTCGTLNIELQLEPEEAVLVTSTCCSTTNSRRPYGELGTVDKMTSCGCCVSFKFGDAVLSPECGCANSLVTEIVAELKARMKQRGDTGQIQRTEAVLNEVHNIRAELNNVNGNIARLDAKMDALISQVAPSAAEMIQRK